MASKHRCSPFGNEPEPLGEVNYATLPPLVAGIHDGPHADTRRRCIVSERTGGTTACKAVVGPAE